MKKYDEVITKDFVTQPGVFAVHRLDEKIHFEIPQEAFGRLMREGIRAGLLILLTLLLATNLNEDTARVQAKAFGATP